MSTSIMPEGRLRYFNNDGSIAAGCKLYTYAAGTTTPKATYTDSAGTTPGTNPIILDAKGEALVYWSGAYKIDLKTADDVQITGYPVDNFVSMDSQVSTSITAILLSYASSIGASLIGFIQSGAGAVLRNLLSKVRENATLFDYIPVAQHAAITAGTSTYDCTADVIKAFVAHDVVTAGPGLYNISTFNLAANKQLLTAGKSTTFQQIAGTAVGTRPISITGSNVVIGSMTVRGNIATDTDEQNHFIFAQATAGTGNLRNLKIGDIDGYDIRGDVVYIGEVSPNTISCVRGGRIWGDNILRNWVSVCGGSDIEFISITGERCGYMAFDIEPEPTNGPVSGVRVGYIKGRSAGLNSASSTVPITGVEIGTLLLAPAHSAPCVPAYAPGAAIDDGLSLRNLKSAKIGYANISGFDRCAIFTTYNVGELGANIDFESLEVSNCSITDAVYNAFVQSPVGHIRVGSLKATVAAANKSVFKNQTSGRIESISATLVASSVLLGNCSNMTLANGVVGTSGFMIQAGTNIAVKDIQFTGEWLATSASTKLSFENVTATGSSGVFSTGDLHSVINSTLNGVYYGSGMTARAYTNPLTFGAYQVWMDANGRMRRKSSAAASDTDGAILHVTTKNTTANRPTFTALDIGGMYFDTTLDADGKPIWWTGTAWVDATGAVV